MPALKPATLSVVIPNYNHGAYLPECLRAMVSQSRRPDEILVIDDASKDNSVAVISEFCAKHPFIKLHRNPENRGVVYNMNLGLSLAQGSYVSFAAADDQVLPGIYEKSLALLEKFPEAGLSSSVCEWRDQQYGYSWHLGAGISQKPEYFSPDAMVRLQKAGKLNMPSHTIIFRKDALQEIGGFKPELKWHTDFMAIQIIGYRYGICYFPELFAIFNLSPHSYSQGAWSQQNQQVLKTMLDCLSSHEYGGASQRIIQSGALYEFGTPMLQQVLAHPHRRRFLNGCFLRKNLWYIIKVTLRKYLPAALAQWYYKTFYRHRQTG